MASCSAPGLPEGEDDFLSVITVPSKFVHYIYDEYWSDDLKKDRFVPEPCIQAHFHPEVRWTYGGSTKRPDLPLHGSYDGLAGMSHFLESFGKTFKVNAWTPEAIVLSESGLTAFVDLAADYTVRGTSVNLKVNELHVLDLDRVVPPDPEAAEVMGKTMLQIRRVRIFFDAEQVAQALARAAKAGDEVGPEEGQPTNE